MNITLHVIIKRYQIIYYNCNFEKNLIEKIGTNLQKFFPMLHVISSTFILFLERSSKEKSNFILRLPRFKSLLSSMISVLGASKGWWN